MIPGYPLPWRAHHRDEKASQILDANNNLVVAGVRPDVADGLVALANGGLHAVIPVVKPERIIASTRQKRKREPDTVATEEWDDFNCQDTYTVNEPCS